MNKIICSTSVTDLVECTKIALIYTTQILVKDRINSYIPSSFPKYAYINQSNDLDSFYYKEFCYELTPEHREDFKFNYVLMIGRDGRTIAFVKLGSLVDTTKLKTETVTIIFELTIDVITNIANLDSEIISTDFKLHNNVILNNDAITKRSIDNYSESTYKPFTSYITDLINNDDYMMKYSGSIIKNKRFVDPISFKFTDQLITKTPYRIIEYNGELTLVFKDNNGFYIGNNNNTIEAIDISNDYVFLYDNDHYKILPISEVYSNDKHWYDLIPSMNYIIDSVTGDTYFYKIGKNDSTYGYTVYTSNNAMGEVYCSSKMQDILENLTNDIPSRDDSPIIMHLAKKSLLAITDGLAVYKDNVTGKLIFHSSLNIVNNENDNIPSKYYEVELDCELADNGVILYSNRSVILKYNSGVYYIYELIKNYMDNYNWTKTELGKDGFLHSIYKIAKQKYTNTSVQLLNVVYRGNLFSKYVKNYQIIDDGELITKSDTYIASL